MLSQKMKKKDTASKLTLFHLYLHVIFHGSLNNTIEETGEYLKQ